MLTLFPSGLGALGCWHIPEAWAGLVPKDGQSWGWRSSEDIPANEPCPKDLACLLASAGAHKLQIQGVLLQGNYAYCTRRMWSLWAGRALKSPVGSTSPGVGVPISRLLLYGHPIYGWKHPPQSGIAGIRICPGGGGKEEGMGHKPWVFLLAHSTLTDNPGTRLSLRLWFPQ